MKINFMFVLLINKQSIAIDEAKNPMYESVVNSLYKPVKQTNQLQSSAPEYEIIQGPLARPVGADVTMVSNPAYLTYKHTQN